jgi:hypothetical protein
VVAGFGGGASVNGTCKPSTADFERRNAPVSPSKEATHRLSEVSSPMVRTRGLFFPSTVVTK